MSSRTLAILAGGFSRRFQKEDSQWLDKVLIEFENKPLLVYLLNKSSQFFPNLNISVNDKEREKTYSRILEKHVHFLKYTVIIDKPNINLEGVLRGIYSILSNNKGNSVQFLPSDRPFMDFRVLKEMKTERDGVSILQYRNGMLEPLLALYGSEYFFPKELLQLPLSRADVFIRLSNAVNLYAIEDILKENNLQSSVFANINTQSDLVKLKDIEYHTSEIVMPEVRNIVRKSMKHITGKSLNDNLSENIGQMKENNHHFLGFIWILYLLKRKEITLEEFRKRGKELLKGEYEFWLKQDMPFLALHSLDDLIRQFPEEKTSEIIAKIRELRKKMEIKPRKTS